MERVIAYIDGFNLYYGLRSKGWRRYYWLDVCRAAELLLRPGQALAQTNYFTSIVRDPPDKNQRQAVYLAALGTLQGIHIHYGHYLANPVVCRRCGHRHIARHEKMTDVNIAVEMLSDAFRDLYDTALIISGDSDLVGPINRVRELFPTKRCLVVFPPDRQSFALKHCANGYLYLGADVLRRSLLPQCVTDPDGRALECPPSWR